MLAYPLPIEVHEHEQIVLSDGTILSALVWLPQNAGIKPVPAILEYLPYRKRDGTAFRDALNHPYVAAHGYACVRVDMRGSGDSEGVLLGEYLQQEQDDALEILKWIANREWCTGSIGMIGISWGGFNGLQVAARRPPELKAVISICSTDDRYDNDIHYMGGCQLVDNFLWAATMFSVAPAPPDPALVGDKWRKLWMERLETGVPYMEEWHRRQRRDDFWKHASICENYADVQCPVYLVGGWLDPYSNSIFRMMENLQCPKKALVGPWGHKYPNHAKTGPDIGFLQESLRWWDMWLKNKETGIMDEPALRCYLQDTVRPQRLYDYRPGHWIAEERWPSPAIKPWSMGLAAGQLADGVSTSREKISVSSPQTVGFASGRFVPYGLDADLPGDQQEEAVGSQVFDSKPFAVPVDFLGAPVVHLRLSSDKPAAFIAAVVSEVLPDGTATRISYTVHNLTHRTGHVDLNALEPGKFIDVALKLNECGQRIGAGSVLRLALSTSYFPTVWPSPEAATLIIDCAHSRLELPTRPENPLDSQLRSFAPAANGPPLKATTLRECKSSNTIRKDLSTGEMTICFDKDEGLFESNENGWRWGGLTTVTCGVRPDDPLSAHAEQNFLREFGRGELDLAIKGWTKMTATRSDWHVSTRMEAWERGQRIFERDQTYTVPRDHM